MSNRADARAAFSLAIATLVVVAAILIALIIYLGGRIPGFAPLVPAYIAGTVLSHALLVCGLLAGWRMMSSRRLTAGRVRSLVWLIVLALGIGAVGSAVLAFVDGFHVLLSVLFGFIALVLAVTIAVIARYSRRLSSLLERGGWNRIGERSEHHGSAWR